MAIIAVQHAECPISLEPLCEGPVGAFFNAQGKRTSSHLFRLSVAEQWLQSKGTCPMTRTQVASVKKLPDPSVDPEAWFRMVDWDGDGKLSREEVIRALQAQLRLDMHGVETMIKDDRLWRRWDRDGSGFIEPQEIQAIKEFLSLPEFKGQAPGMIPDIVQDTNRWFDYWDDDMGGTLDKEEVVRALVKTLRKAELTNYALQEEMRSTLDMIWFLFDPDMDGHITKEEFSKADGLAETVIAQLSMRPAPSSPRPAACSLPQSRMTESMECVAPVLPNAAQALAGY